MTSTSTTTAWFIGQPIGNVNVDPVAYLIEGQGGLEVSRPGVA